MNVSPLISVIIPTYNSENYILSTINSVLNQHYPNVEIIIVDDFSRDSIEKIIDKIVIGDSKIIIKKLTANSGPAIARNIAINLASGELIAFLDSDDTWKPKKLQTQVEILLKNPEIDLLFTEVEIYDQISKNINQYSKINKIFDRNLSLEKVKNNNNLYKLKGNFKKELYSGNFICISSVVIKKEAIKKVNCFDEKRFGTEDIDLWVRLADNFNFYYLHEVLVTYNWMDTSISRINKKRLSELLNYHKSNLYKDDYQDVHDIIYKNLYLTYKSLIIEYSKKWDIRRAFSTFFESRNYPLKKGLFYYAISCILGPLPLFCKLNVINPLKEYLKINYRAK